VNEKDSDVNVDGWSEVPVEGGGQGGDDDGGDDNPGGGEGGDPQTSTAPTMTWDANPNFEPTPIESSMDVNILIKAPEAIKDFLVVVDSNILSETIAQMGGHSEYSYAPGNPFVMDLIHDDALTSALGGMIPVKDQLEGQTEVNFSLSDLVPLILVYGPESGSRHTFTLKVTDTKDQTLEKPVVFVMP
jgi:hypothetical protein